MTAREESRLSTSYPSTPHGVLALRSTILCLVGSTLKPGQPRVADRARRVRGHVQPTLRCVSGHATNVSNATVIANRTATPTLLPLGHREGGLGSGPTPRC